MIGKNNYIFYSFTQTSQIDCFRHVYKFCDESGLAVLSNPWSKCEGFMLAKCRRLMCGFPLGDYALGDFAMILTPVIQVTYDWLTRFCLLLKYGI